MARPAGLEPAAPRFEVSCSLQLGYGRLDRSYAKRRTPKAPPARTLAQQPSIYARKPLAESRGLALEVAQEKRPRHSSEESLTFSQRIRARSVGGGSRIHFVGVPKTSGPFVRYHQRRRPMGSSRYKASARQRIATARERGRREARAANALVKVAFDASTDRIELSFGSGATVGVPRTRVRELRRISRSALAAASVSPAGDAVSWRSADVDINVHGLIERLFLPRRVES